MQVIAGTGLALLKSTGIVQFSWGNPACSTGCEVPIIGGDSACPPEPPQRFAIGLCYLLWSDRIPGVTAAAGAKAYAEAPGSVIYRFLLHYTS